MSFARNWLEVPCHSLLICLSIISAVKGCAVLPSGQERTVNFVITGYTLPVGFTWTPQVNVAAQLPNILRSEAAVRSALQSLVMQAVFNALEEQGRRAGIGGAILSAALQQVTVQTTYSPMRCFVANINPGNAALMCRLAVVDKHKVTILDALLSANSTTETESRLSTVSNTTESGPVESETNSTIEFTTTKPKSIIMIPLSLENDENFEDVSLGFKDTFSDLSQKSKKSKTSNVSTVTAAEKPTKNSNIPKKEVTASSAPKEVPVLSSPAAATGMTTARPIRAETNDGKIRDTIQIARKIVNLFVPKKANEQRRLNLEQVLMKVRGNRKVVSHDIGPPGDEIPLPIGWKLTQIR
ncbi:unnamed protein product [Angiostrongylus costaricensis]|uniref:Secreted protein n=1 Tax=Angiostrongylus costaricensis TaxID=334426 RepID=A0A0R3PHW9_ANGCS|nr:unnamed protein product [Angiostrongylus costaricensis]